MTNTYPKITLITPSYNQAQYIEQTITSVLDQNYPNLDYIIIDGGSTDGSVDIIKKYEKHLAYWISEPDNGQAHAINKGLNWVYKQLTSSSIPQSSHFFNWLNSDDYLELGALYAVARAFQKKKKAQVVCGYTRCFWDETGKTSHTYRMGLKRTPTQTLLNIKMNQPGTFYKLDVIKKLGGINETLRYVFDNELWMRFLCRYGQKQVVRTKALLAHFRQHGNSKSFGEGFSRFNQEHMQILYGLAQQSIMPDYLIKCMENHYTPSSIHQFTDSLNPQSYSPKNWHLNHFNASYFHAWLANKYMVTLWNEGKKNKAKIALKQALWYNTFKLNRKNIGLLRKVVFKF